MEGHHPAVEQYLETILELEESGVVPMRARLVERLGVSAPAVSETVKRLEREGYLTLDGDRVTGEARHLQGIGRVRDVEVARDGSVMLLTDARNGALVRVTRD